MRKIQSADLDNKNILLRVDFNVEVDEGGMAKEKLKLGSTRKSLEYILSKNAKVALLSWFGRPDGIDEKFSLRPLADDAADALGVKVRFIEDCVGKSISEKLRSLEKGEVLLMENVRFHKGEKNNDDIFSKRIADNFDIFIQDAFSVCHRDNASVTGVPKFLPSYAGFALQEEIEKMDSVISDPKKPAIAIIGGSKIETKLPLIKRFEKIYDHVLVGGKVANEAIDQKLVFSEKVVLPIDFKGDRFDIGEETVQRFKDIIEISETIVWNGPLGKFEENPYDEATRIILNTVANSKAFTLIGGGESVQVLEENGMLDKISFVSTGGGAMLEYLSGNIMPGIEALN